MTLNEKLCDLLTGEAYIQEDGLATYHAAQRVKHALRRKNPIDRLSGVREALNRYRVTSWLTDDGKIEFRKNGQPALVL